MTSILPSWHERVALRVVECLASSPGQADSIEEILRAILEETGVHAAGIRLRDDNDYPFYVVRGHTDEFVRQESGLCFCGADGVTVCDAHGRAMLACLCGAVLSGRSGFAPGCQLASGSFFASNLQVQARSIETRHLPMFRGRCVTDGAETLALIALRHQGELIGLLHLSDPRPNIFDDGDIDFLERIGASIGAALGRSRAEEASRVAREKLSEREQFYRAIFEDNRAIKLLIDPDRGLILDANEAACEYYGYSRKQLMSMRIMDINVLSAEEVLAEMALATSEKRRTFYFRHRLASGEIRDVEVYSGPVEVGGSRYLYSIILDVTARRRAEEALAKSAWALRERYKELSCLFAVSKLCERPALPLDELLEGVVQLLPPAYQFPEDASARIELDGQAHVTPGFDATPARQTTPIAVNGVQAGRIDIGYCPARSAKGDGLFLAEELPLLQAVAERVGQAVGRQRADAALRRNAALLSAISEGTTDTIYVKDRQGRYLMINAAACEATGRRMEDALGKDDGAFFAEDEAREIMAGDRRVMDSGSTQTFEENLTLAGVQRVFLSTKGPVHDAEGAVIGLFGIARDITERKQAEKERASLMEQLNHAQKMEAVGTLAGGVAHDFNNILAGLLSGLSVLELDLGAAAGDYREALDDMKGLVQRGSDLARQLLGFSRRGKYDVRPLDLAAVVQKTSTMFGRTRRDVTFHGDFAQDLKSVLMDHAQLEQVLLNLFLNAGQAMPEGGRILLRGENAILTAEQAEPRRIAPGRYVKLVVADTGVGMDAATRARIFEPFFTTKAPGHGSGLGLASVYGIVKNHGGIIDVESVPGEGTTFTLLLPATDEPVLKKPVEAAVVVSGHGTILVVDDEPELLKLCARLLAAMGYEVLTAGGGRAAVDIMREHHARVSLVILDLTMPDMSGASTFEAIRGIAPEVKVLLASGFSVDGQAQELLARGCCGFLQKPFTLAELAEKLRLIQ